MEARQRQQEAMNALNQAQEQRQPDEVAVSDASRDDENDDKESDESRGLAGGGLSTTNETQPESKVENAADQTVNELSSSIENLDKKPLGSTTVRGKRVRIATPETGLGPYFDEHAPTSEHAVFPAFYRVVQDAGAAVYNDGHEFSFVIRVVPFGVVVIGQEMAWRNCDGESQMMVRIPDGWVIDEQLERIVAVPFDS